MKLISIHDGHNASVAFMENGKIVFAIQEERLVKIKNAGGFPSNSLQSGLEYLGWELDQVERIVFTGRYVGNYPLEPRTRIIKKYNNFFQPFGRNNDLFWPEPPSVKSVISGLKSVIRTKLGRGKRTFVHPDPPEKTLYLQKDKFNTSQLRRVKPIMDKGFLSDKVHFLEHHLCHASAATYGQSQDKPTLVITSDSAGDGLSGSVSIFDQGKLERKLNIHHRNSVAQFYSLLTFYLGLLPMEHEYKIMGMSPYALNSPDAREIADTFHSIYHYKSDGIEYELKDQSIATKFLAPWLFKEMRFRRFDHISAGIQLFLEEFIVDWVKRLVNHYQISNLAMAGGLFMNVKMNQHIRELKEVDSIFVFPSCGDETNTFGALYYLYNKITGKTPLPLDNFYTGTDISEDDVLDGLKKIDCEANQLEYKKYDDVESETARLLANGEVVARCKGRMEFGARALGNRSILSAADSPTAITIINQMVKKRDFWMPFAPAMINSERYLEEKKGHFSPYMMQTFQSKKEAENDLYAVCQQYDKTCRVQDVTEELNKDYYRIIENYEKLTGKGVIMNTSFNLHGFPIVRNSFEALEVLTNSGLKYLAVGDYIVCKK